jgi:hypothetical protein
MNSPLDKSHPDMLRSPMRDLPVTPHKGAIRRNGCAARKPDSPLLCDA